MESAISRARCYASAIKPRRVAIRGPRGLGQDNRFVKRAATRTQDSALLSCLSAIAIAGDYYLLGRSTMPILFPRQGFAGEDFDQIRVGSGEIEGPQYSREGVERSDGGDW